MDTTAGPPTLPSALRLGPVALTVTSLERSVAFYETAIGLRLHRRDDDAGHAALGAGRQDLLVLVEDSSARAAGRHAGLYHVAFLHPSRHELARAAVRLAATRTPLDGASDHGISEALYLPDPDGNGIELAADRGREHWGDLSDPTAIGGPQPLDMASLLAMCDGEEVRRQADDTLRIGHVHLHVGDVDQGLAFYRDIVGFEVMTNLGSAAFVSAGGYHHHLAFNVWRGQGVGPVPPGVVGLRHWTLVMDAPEIDALREHLVAAGAPAGEAAGALVTRDPWGIELRATASD